MRVTLGKQTQLEVELEVFDFDDPKAWKRVQAVLNDPLVLRALDAGMQSEISKQWNPERGPWSYSRQGKSSQARLKRHPPQPGTPGWYRVFGCHHAMSPWATAVGSLLYPKHQWSVAYSFGLESVGSHSAGIGFRDNKSVIIMDILWGRRSLQPVKGKKLLKQLLRQPSFSYPLEKALVMLEAGERLHEKG